MKRIVEYKEGFSRLLLDKHGLAARYRVGIRTVENWLAFEIIRGRLECGKVIFDASDCDSRIVCYSQNTQQQRKEGKR